MAIGFDKCIIIVVEERGDNKDFYLLMQIKFIYQNVFQSTFLSLGKCIEKSSEVKPSM